jgi:hypothetical protein
MRRGGETIEKRRKCIALMQRTMRLFVCQTIMWISSGQMASWERCREDRETVVSTARESLQKTAEKGFQKNFQELLILNRYFMISLNIYLIRCMYYKPLILSWRMLPMKKISMTMATIFASAILLGSAIVLSPVNRAYAHTFSGDENVAFLSMVQAIKIETSLAGNNTSNKDVANHHVEHAAEALTNSTVKEIAEKNQRIATDLPASIEKLKASINSANAIVNNVKQQVQGISDLLDEAVQVRIDPAQVSNTTVKASVVANLVNEALEHYGEAVGFQGSMTDMSAMASMQAMNKSSSNMQANTATKIVSEPNYQSAIAFAQKSQELYQQIKAKALPGKENAVKALDGAFPAFVKAIKDKASPMEIMNLAHLRIQPNLMEAYNLKLAAG